MWYFRSFAWILPLKRARGEIDYAIGGPPAITDLFREEKKENLCDRTVSFLNMLGIQHPYWLHHLWFVCSVQMGQIMLLICTAMNILGNSN